jgi:arylformamidase
MRIHDISQSVSEDIAVWPGDTPFAQEWVMRIQDGMSCNVSTITMSVHCGTHTDAPYHFVESAPKMADVPLEPYIGPCRVVHITPEGSPPRIPASAFDDVQPGERILFRTCEGLDPNTFDEDFCSLGPSAARAAVERGIQLIGLDTPSMDEFTSKTMESHKLLLNGGVSILENLDLREIPEGRYELIALPLKLAGCDSSPVRAVLRELA